MSKELKKGEKENRLQAKVKLCREEAISLFEKRSKNSLSKDTKKERLNEIYDEYFFNIFHKNSLRWLGDFSVEFGKLFNKNNDITEQYLQFVTSYMQSLTTIVNLSSSKIDMADLEKFYKKIDVVNQKFIESNKSKEKRQSHFELQQMFDAITDPLFVVDKDLNLLRINKFLKDKLNISNYNEVLGKKANRIKYEGEPLCSKSDLKEVFEKGNVYISDVHSRDDKNFYIQYIYPIRVKKAKSGSVNSALVYKKDMTMHKSLEEEIQHLNRLATVGKLSAIVAHEIRNPLSGIGLSASLLKKKLAKDWKYFDSIENILVGIDRIESVILRLLDFSKPKKPNRRKASILDPLRESLFFIKSRAEKQSISITEEYPESIPSVFIDPDQMTQVFINLLLNAIQSIESSGTISIKITAVSYHNIILKITDSGAGIKDEDIPHIFEPFFTTKQDGTGLGLTITKNIILQNDIDISVESKPGKGTTFTLKVKAYHEI